MYLVRIRIVVFIFTLLVIPFAQLDNVVFLVDVLSSGRFPEFLAMIYRFYGLDYSGLSFFLLAGTTVASSLMDKQGRRSLLMGSYAGMVRPLVVAIRV